MSDGLPIHGACSYWQCCLEQPMPVSSELCPFPDLLNYFFHPLFQLIHFSKWVNSERNLNIYLWILLSFHIYKAMEEISRFPLAKMPHFLSRLWPANPLHQIEVELSGVTWRNILIHGLRRVLCASPYATFRSASVLAKEVDENVWFCVCVFTISPIPSVLHKLSPDCVN